MLVCEDSSKKRFNAGYAASLNDAARTRYTEKTASQTFKKAITAQITITVHVLTIMHGTPTWRPLLPGSGGCGLVTSTARGLQ